MALSEGWSEAFPGEAKQDVVAFVRNTWNDLVARKTPKFDPSSKEPHLTEFLCMVLKTKQDLFGFTGLFTAEERDSDPNLITGELENRRRTDIKYFSDRTNVYLTMEFKKLEVAPKSSRRYCGEEGMDRFIVGKYSKDDPVAVMVGIIGKQPKDCIHRLKQIIKGDDVRDALCMLPSATGDVIDEPSQTMSQIAQFDTKHSRTKCGAGELTLCHLFLLYGQAANDI